jgi:hypothetical protein
MFRIWFYTDSTWIAAFFSLSSNTHSSPRVFIRDMIAVGGVPKPIPSSLESKEVMLEILLQL